MKIATWNVERLKHKKSFSEIQSACNTVGADILILTETDQRLRPNYRFCFETSLLSKFWPKLYHPTENRVTICTNYPCVRVHPTYDERSSLCVELKTERGCLLVYGTIIGAYGNRHPSFVQDLREQMRDIDRLSNLSDGFCFCGDYNCSFSDNYYFTQVGRQKIISTFEQNRLALLTGRQPECIDHISITEDFLGDGYVQIEEWNHRKLLSDHKGIAVTF